MKLKLLRLEVSLELSPDSVSTLEIENRTLFTRTVRSLLSEEGEYSDEPYVLLNDDGLKVSPKKALRVINVLPDVPLNDRIMIARLLKLAVEQSELSPELHEQIRLLSSELQQVTDEIVSGLRGDYSLGLEWSYETYLKSFGLAPVTGRDFSLLDNCIRLFGLCADIGDYSPIVMVNAKSFFSENELEELFDQAVFSGIKLLLLESWNDARSFALEQKTVIDQHLCTL